MNKTYLEVRKDLFLENVKKIENYISPRKIIPVLKANAYGTYLNRDLDCINHFDIIALARVDEGIEVRKLGYQKEIFILNQPALEELEDIYRYQLTIGISLPEMIDKITQPVKVHLEIETGMNRTGIVLKDLENVIERIKKNPNITVEGIYTHFSSADIDISYTEKQIQIFQEAVSLVKKEFPLIYIHSSASSGLLNYKDNVSNYTRPGILLYGYEPFPMAKNLIPVEPITELVTEITFLKDVEENTPISYNQTYLTKSKTKIATIPIGYADGFRRILSNHQEVFVNGKRCPVIGNICMDSCMIDVTGIDCKVGDKVILWDNQNITLEEISKNSNTISYEILSTISERIHRIIK